MATSTAQQIATVPVWDYLYPPGDPTNTNPKALAGKRVTVTLSYAQAQSGSPVTLLGTDPVVTQTDGNGFWQVNLVPNNKISPNGTIYKVEIEGYRSYVIQVTDVNAPAIGWQSSAIATLPPVGGGAPGYTLPGGTTILGSLTINGSEILQGPNDHYDVTHPLFGAQGTGSGDDGPPINSAIATCSAAGGGTVWLPPTPSMTYAIQTRLVGASNVLLKGAPGVTIKWTGATNTQMLWTNPTSGNNVQRFHIEDLIFNTSNTSLVTALFLQSWQYSRITSVKCITNFDATGVRIETNVGTDFRNNCMFNTVRDLRVSTAAIALQMSGTPTCGPTDQWFFGFICDDIYQGGIREVQYCDSNLFYGTRVSATGVPNANWYGVILNDSATPNADVGVYDEQFYGIFVDNSNGPASAAAFVLNWQRQCHVYGLWTGVGAGSPGTTVKDNFSQSHAIELLQNTGVPNSSIVFTKNYGYGPLGLGFDLANYIQVAGAASGSAPLISAKGTVDANVNVSIAPKGNGVIVLNQQLANFQTMSGSGSGGPPYLSTGGSDTNVDLALLLQGTGVLRLKPGNGMSTTAAGALNLGTDGIATSVGIGSSVAVVKAGAQFYPAAEALGTQTTGGILHSTGVPANGNGNNNDWCISDNGHIYFKRTGVWTDMTAAVTSQATPGNPAGTASTTGAMMGLAGSITPLRTGNILVIISGDILNATAIADGGSAQIRFGTGTAPTNGTTTHPGTAAGAKPQYIAATTAEKAPFSVQAVITGLTLGTAVWLDLEVAAITGGTAAVENISISAVEV